MAKETANHILSVDNEHSPHTSSGGVVSSAVPQEDNSPRRRSLLSYIALAGPAFVAGAWQFGPGNLTTAVQAGSNFGYRLVWVIAVSTLLMLFLVDMSVRIGIKAPVSMISSIKDTLGTFVGALAGFGVFLICLCFSVGNAVGAGLGLTMLFGGNPVMWTLVTSVTVGAILFARQVYKVIEKVLIVIVALMGIAFVISAFMVHPEWDEAARGLIPSIPDNAWLLIIALVGTNFSVNAAFYTSYGTKEHKRTEKDYKDLLIADTIPGIVAPGIMTILVIVVAAATLGATGATASTLPELAKVFEPLAGPVGSFIFSLGFFGAAFSSMTANATAGGTIVSDALGKGHTANSPVAKIGMTLILLFGLTITLFFQAAPVQLIVTAQAATVFIAPLLAFFIILMANNKKLMGSMANRWWHNTGGLIGLAAILVLSFRLIVTLI
ncbi:Nramp family divalent metal transporter [Corynebacterium glutamicum]|uniref:Nramp family divalent metal transporter n=1 Tax=Corynebacterium glutamicum TaxID=1718 RepID=UPI0009D72136|nr:Nramp family divalent metal transporter [Corynebacterium glutamicum]